MSKRLIQIFCLLMFSFSLLAGTNGKISGIVKDRSTGEALPGVNVYIEGTSLGSSTDIDGFYVILNVPVGSHTVLASYVGYNDVKTNNVVVSVDLTTEVNIEMDESVGGTDVVVVEATRSLVRKDETNNIIVKTGAELKNLPVADVQGMIANTAGVAKNDNSDAMYTRGGRSNETAIVVDGVNQNNLLDGTVIARVSRNAIEQMQVQTGGFNAEYGDVLSGLIHITQKSGSEKYEAAFETYTDRVISDDIFGGHNYGHTGVNGYVSGPIIPGNNKFLFFANVDFIEKADKAPTYAVNGIGRKPGNSEESLTINLKTKVLISDATILKLGANLTDASDHNYTHWKYFAPHSLVKRNSEAKSLTMDLTHTFSKNLFIQAKASTSWNYTERGDKRLMGDLKAYGDPVRNNYATSGVAPGSANPYRIAPVYAAAINPINGELTYTPANLYEKKYDEKRQFDLAATYQYKSHSFKAGFNYTTHIVRGYNISPRQLAAAGFDGSFAAFRDQGSIRNYGYDFWGNESDADDWSYYDNVNELNGTEKFGDGPKEPTSYGIFVQDKIELEDVVLSLGVRFDSFNANTWAFKDVKTAYADGKFSADDVKDSETFTSLSPRIGVSFPVDETSKFSANFGTFFQFPNLQALYASRAYATERFEKGAYARVMENPNLKPQRTTAYEVSYQKEVSEDISIKINAFYKETADLINERLIDITNAANDQNQQISIQDNIDFGFIKGVDLGFNTRRINNLMVSGNVTLQSATATGSTSTGNSRISWLGGTLPRSVNAVDHDQPITGNLTMDYRFTDDAPEVFGSSLLNDMGLSLITSFNSGRPFTKYDEGVDNPFTSQTSIPVQSVVNGARGPFRFKIDFRIDKTFQLMDNSLALNVYLDVQNVFNIKNELYLYDGSGDADFSGWLGTPTGKEWLKLQEQANAARGADAYPLMHASWAEAARFYEMDPENYGSPRQVTAGLRIEF